MTLSGALARFFSVSLVLLGPSVAARDGEGFCLVVLPDTQFLASHHPHIFDAQTQWIRDNAAALDIRYVLHLGDVTNDNCLGEWTNARNSMSLLDGLVPYAISLGNHDLGPGGHAANRESMFNDPAFFGPGSPYAAQPSIGGFYEASRTDNSWHTFSASGRDWIVLALEWGPRDAVVEWARQVLDQHPNHVALITTHAYMHWDETRYDWGLRGDSQALNPHHPGYGTSSLPGGTHDGQELWDELVRERNVAMVFSGHATGDGTALLTSVGDDGQVVHQMLSNYQDDPNGGNGFLRLVRVQPDGETVHVESYSPFLDEYKTDRGHVFTLGILGDPVGAAHGAAIVRDEPALYYRLERDVGPGVANEGVGGSALEGLYVGPGPTAAEFDGVGSQVESVSALPGADHWSIEAWVRTRTPAEQTVFTNDRDGFNDDVLLGLAPAGGAVSTADRWAVIHEDQTSLASTVVEASQPATHGRWSHLVATADGEVLRLYIDGALVGESPRAGDDLRFDGGLCRVGRSFLTVSGGRPFDGAIGEVVWSAEALSATDVITHYMEARHRVTAANVSVPGPAIPGMTAVPAEVEGAGFPGVETLPVDTGDMRVLCLDAGLSFHEGVLLATVRQNERDGLQATAEVGRSSFDDGILAVSTTQAGYTSGTNEVHIDTALAWFPFGGGWRGAHVDGDGTVAEQRGDGISISPTNIGRYELDLGVASDSAGMLFTVGGSDGDNIVPTGLLAGGEGWDLRVQDNAADLAQTGEAAPFSFVYVPYDTPGLVGGRYDGVSGSQVHAVGTFTMARLGPGEYYLRLPNESPDTGVLILTVCHQVGTGPGSAPEDNVLSYEDDGAGAFLIHSRDLPGLELEDTGFVWSFLPWRSVSNRNGIGVDYCGPARLNSSGFPAQIAATGSDAVLAGDLTLHAALLPEGQFGYFLTSLTQAFVPSPAGSEGDLCLGGTIGRFSSQAQYSGADGSFSIVVDLTALPLLPAAAVQPGDTWNFQAWFRDVGSTSNFTDGVSVTFR